MLTVAAEGAQTRYPLSWTGLDEPLTQPIPVRVDAPFSEVENEKHTRRCWVHRLVCNHNNC